MVFRATILIFEAGHLILLVLTKICKVSGI